MYRGSGGAEVALLLRRLLNRLGIDASRVRFILTSASFSGEARGFAEQLTGKDQESWHHQTAEPITYRQEPAYGTQEQALALSRFGEEQGQLVLPSLEGLNVLADTFQWPEFEGEVSEAPFGSARVLIACRCSGSSRMQSSAPSQCRNWHRSCSPASRKGSPRRLPSNSGI